MSSLYRLAVLTALKTLKLWLRRLFGFHLASRQWGLLVLTKPGDIGVYDYCRFPISFSDSNYSIIANHRGNDAVIAYQLVTEINANYCVLCAKKYDGTKGMSWDLNWIAVGK